MYFLYITRFDSVIIVDSIRKEKFLIGNFLHALPYVTVPNSTYHIEIDKTEFLFIKENYALFL